MENKYFKKFDPYTNEQLLSILVEGTDRNVALALDAAEEILKERGQTNLIKEKLTAKYEKYSDAALVELAQSDDDRKWMPKTNVVEGILTSRGFDVEIEEAPALIQVIDSKSNKEYADQSENRFNTISETPVFSDTKLTQIKRMEPRGQLIVYRREIVRHGRNLLKIVDSDGTKSYVLKAPANIFLCTQHRVMREPMDVLLINHRNFDYHIASNSIRSRLLDESQKDKEESHTYVNNNHTYVLTKDRFRKDDHYFSSTNLIRFKDTTELNVKLARLKKDATFYRLGQEVDTMPRKIKLTDGREAVVISNADCYDEIDPPLFSFVKNIVIVLYILIVGAAFLVMFKAGFILVIGVVFVILAFVLFAVIGIPLFLLLDYIIKRL